jgi:hypothetical protein
VARSCSPIRAKTRFGMNPGAAPTPTSFATALADRLTGAGQQAPWALSQSPNLSCVAARCRTIPLLSLATPMRASAMATLRSPELRR